jgi:integrase
VDDRLTYRMLKTNGSVSLKLPKEALELARRYSEEERVMFFPFVTEHDTADPTHFRRRVSSANVIVNRNLKKLAELAGIPSDGLSTHVARHSFADYARTSDGDLYAISKALGHSDLKTTETYLKSFDQDSVDDLSDSLWSEMP